MHRPPPSGQIRSAWRSTRPRGKPPSWTDAERHVCDRPSGTGRWDSFAKVTAYEHRQESLQSWPAMRPVMCLYPAPTGSHAGRFSHQPRRRFSSQAESGAPGRNRTSDTRFRKPVLYPLSYEGRGPEGAVWARGPTAAPPPVSILSAAGRLKTDPEGSIGAMDARLQRGSVQADAGRSSLVISDVLRGFAESDPRVETHPTRRPLA
jgi:hypothetical protein